jgi:hypothetical protein
MKTLRLLPILVSSLIVTVAGVAQALPIAYDGIQYSPGGVIVVPPGLSSFMDKPSSGLGVGGNFNFQAPLTNPQAPAPGKEFWASFLLEHTAPNDETYMGLSPAGAVFGSPPAVGFGVRLGQYGIFVGGVFTPCGVPFTPAGSTDFLVTHFTASGGAWVVQLFVNKGSFLVPDLVMNVAPVIYGTMQNLNESAFESDEFRLGDFSNDVAAGGATPAKWSTWGRVKQLYK